MTGDIELTKLPRRGIAPLLESARDATGLAARKAAAASRQALARLRAKLAERTAAMRARGAHSKAALAERTVASQSVPQGPEHVTRLNAFVARAHGLFVQARTLLGSDARPTWFLVAVGAAGLGVAIGLIAVVVSLVRSGETVGRSLEPVASASASSSAVEPPVAPAPHDDTPVASPAASPGPAASVPLAAGPLLPCTVAAPPQLVAPSAMVAAGVEVVRLGSDVAVGFAPTDLDALALRLDADSMATSATAKAHSHDPVRRATPMSGPRGSVSVAVDADRKGDRLQGRRTVAGDPPLQFGATDDGLLWARASGGPEGELWHLDEGPAVEALRGSTEGEGPGRTTALAFRRGSTIWMGATVGSGPLQSTGPLAHVEGLGTVVGSPAVAINEGSILVAWADRPSSEDPWRLRWTRFDTGSQPSTPQVFVPPAGGKGEQAMSPAIAPLPRGRFLLVWTEGKAAGHDVRALTLARDGQPIGAPLAVSNAGVNAGQGQAAVSASGKGVVAFLESNGTAFQVAATPVSCP
jgi:hypothetical protein